MNVHRRHVLETRTREGRAGTGRGTRLIKLKRKDRRHVVSVDAPRRAAFLLELCLIRLQQQYDSSGAEFCVFQEWGHRSTMV